MTNRPETHLQAAAPAFDGDWQTWLAEKLINGVSLEEISRELIARGLTPDFVTDQARSMQ
jgi:hypothetical protein